MVLNGFILAAVVLLAALPLVLHPTAAFSGTDEAASQAIARAQPGYLPWFRPLWRPPSSEVETLLFALQAALGAGAIGYYFGLKRGQRLSARRPADPRPADPPPED